MFSKQPIDSTHPDWVKHRATAEQLAQVYMPETPGQMNQEDQAMDAESEQTSAFDFMGNPTQVGAKLKAQQQLVPKGKARTTTWLGVEHGFGIRHYPSGRNVYIVQTRMAGRMRTVTIGPASVLTRYQAQMVARRVIAYAQVGRDPATERQRIRSAPSFADFVTEYWERWAPRWKASTLDAAWVFREIGEQ